MIVAEAYTRSQIKRIINTSLEDKDIAQRLRPLHREIQDLLEFNGKEALNFSLPMAKIVVKEKEPYQRLLEELTQLIRQHTSSAGAEAILQQPSSDSPIHHAVEQVQEEVLKRIRQEKKDKKIIITVKPDNLQRVTKTLLPPIDPEHEQALFDLLTTGSSMERIKFTGNSLQLGEIFQRLEEKGILQEERLIHV